MLLKEKYYSMPIDYTSDTFKTKLESWKLLVLLEFWSNRLPWASGRSLKEIDSK